MVGFVTDNQRPTCSKTLKPNPLPPLPLRVVDLVGEREESSHNFEPILAPPPSLVTPERENEIQFVPPSPMAPPPPPSAASHANGQEFNLPTSLHPMRAASAPTSADHVNENHALPSFKSAFPNVYEQRFSPSQHVWYPSAPDNHHQRDSSRYPHQPNTGTSCYQNQRSVYNNNGFNSHDHSYANRGPFTTDHQDKVHNPCMANEIFSFLKTCVHQLDVAMTNGPASSKLSSCVHVLQEIRDVIISGENQFNYDLIHNGHKGHDYTYCSSGTSKQRNASTQVEQEPGTDDPIETVTLSPNQNQAMRNN